MKSTSVASFSGLYVMRWLSRFLKHMSHRSRSNAKSYEMFHGIVSIYLEDAKCSSNFYIFKVHQSFIRSTLVLG